MTEYVLAETGEFPDVALLVRLYLRDNVTLGGSPVTVTDEPRNPLDPPVIPVLWIPGPAPARRARSWETSRRIETGPIGTTYADARVLAAQTENLMLALHRKSYRGVLFDGVEPNTTPGQVPYAPDVRRIPQSWDVTVRRHKNARVVVEL